MRASRAGLAAALGAVMKPPSPGISSPSPPTPQPSPSSASTPRNMFEFWDWVGGRYSLWSAIGLPIAALHRHGPFRGPADGRIRDGRAFPQRTAGKQHAGDHGPARDLVHQLLGMPRATPCCPTTSTCTASRPTCSSSTWKATASAFDRNGKTVDYTTGPVIWGEPGTNGQHAFYQLIHQGTKLIPADFLAPVESHNPIGDHHAHPALQFLRPDRSADEGQERGRSPRRTGSGRHERRGAGRTAAAQGVPRQQARPTPFCSANSTPHTLGALIALYEHKVFVQGMIWNLNSFDQWGVELGKQLAQQNPARAGTATIVNCLRRLD